MRNKKQLVNDIEILVMTLMPVETVLELMAKYETFSQSETIYEKMDAYVLAVLDKGMALIEGEPENEPKPVLLGFDIEGRNED